MSMELWQRLKDLEKKVQEQSDRLKDLEDPATWQPSASAALPVIKVESSFTKTISGSTKGPKPCPKCGKASAYYFHVKNCKGNAEVA
jgi:hypothetical protein